MSGKPDDEGDIMGLDMSIIRTPTNLNLSELYAVREAVVNGMDWYLGDDKEKRFERHLELKRNALCLGREKVLSESGASDEIKEYISKIEPNQFGIYLAWVIGSIEDFSDKNNTHLGFDWDLLPGMTIIDSCSWNLHDIFDQCAIRHGNPDENSVVELDKDKIGEVFRKWKSRGFKMKIAKLIGYVFPNVGTRIAEDCIKELAVNDRWIDIDDLLYYRESVMKVAKFMQDTDRIWLVSSY